MSAIEATPPNPMNLQMASGGGHGGMFARRLKKRKEREGIDGNDPRDPQSAGSIVTEPVAQNASPDAPVIPPANGDWATEVLEAPRALFLIRNFIF